MHTSSLDCGSSFKYQIAFHKSLLVMQGNACSLSNAFLFRLGALIISTILCTMVVARELSVG